jgi:hypothetical protein
MELFIPGSSILTRSDHSAVSWYISKCHPRCSPNPWHAKHNKDHVDVSCIGIAFCLRPPNNCLLYHAVPRNVTTFDYHSLCSAKAQHSHLSENIAVNCESAYQALSGFYGTLSDKPLQGFINGLQRGVARTVIEQALCFRNAGIGTVRDMIPCLRGIFV